MLDGSLLGQSQIVIPAKAGIHLAASSLSANDARRAVPTGIGVAG
jgi:hypothetical protein